MKTYRILLIATAVALVSFKSQSQLVDPNAGVTAPAVPIIDAQTAQVFQFLTTPTTNWYFAAYAIQSMKTHDVGAGVAALYKVNDYMGTALRLDALNLKNLDGQLYMPSCNFQLQLPIRIMGKVDVIPLILSGVAIPLGGNGNSDTVAGIFGAGIAVRIPSTKWYVPSDVFCDLERWTNVDGNQLRAGAVWRF